MKAKKLRLLTTALSCVVFFSTFSNIGSVRTEASSNLGENIALNKKVTAISTSEDSDTVNVTDGDVESIWKSSTDYNRWVEIDLEGVYDVKNIKVNTPVGFIANYNIYMSEDGEKFKKVATEIGDNVSTEEGKVYAVEGKACKIRIDVTYNNQSYGQTGPVAYINEVGVYGDKVSDEAPVVPEISTDNFDDSEYGKRYKEMEENQDIKNNAILNEAKALVGRVIGEKHIKKFQFELRESQNGKDSFTIEDNEGNIRITGPNGISLASGVNYYLKNVMKVDYDPLNGNADIKIDGDLKPIGSKVVKETPYDYKYALNFCTPSYTMAFWNWDEYEEFLDWAAMNGINLMLDILGQEEVQRRTLKQFNYSDEDVKNYIPGPAYYAWFYMANMQSFGGPLPNDWFEQRTELGRKVHERMYIYGIDPVFLGFAGQVPLDFKSKNPDAQIIDQGYWPGGKAFDRPPMLKTYVDSGEDYFTKVADVYYEELKKTFGDITNYYAVDPFHEGGNKGGLDETLIAKTVQEKMIQHNEDSTWVIQNWQNNPTQKFLNGIKKDQAVVIDLYADNQPHYKDLLTGATKPEYMKNDYDGTPWIWGMLHSFGGRMGFSGMPEILAKEMPNQLKSSFMKGIGVTAESLGTNPLLYEMIYDMGWEKEPINEKDYISTYFENRYGIKSENIENAWDIMCETAYHKRYDRQRAEDSIINAQPNLNATSASGYITAIIDYDKVEFEKILNLYLKEYDNLKDNKAYQYDLADITRQVLSNVAYEYLQGAKNAFNSKDNDTFRVMSNKFLDIIKIQDRVLGTQEEFLIGRWIEDSRTMLDDMDDWTKDLFEFNARAQITSWGSYTANSMLKDYSNRQWNGLTGDYYYMRWSKYFEELQKSADAGIFNQNVNINWFDLTYRWVNKKGNGYITESNGENLEVLAKEVIENYSVTNELLQKPQEEKNNIALKKPTRTDGTVKQATANAVDGSATTVWENTNFTNGNLYIDLQNTYDVDGMELVFEKPTEQKDNPNVYAYKIEVMDKNGNWIVVDDKSEDISEKDVVVPIDYKGYAQQVKITIPKADMTLNPSATPKIAEVKVFEGPQGAIGDAIEKVNIAKDKIATASRSANTTSRGPQNVVDGNNNTFWSAGVATGEEWIKVDLGKDEEFSNINLGFETEGRTFSYKVEVFDEADNLVGEYLDKINDNSGKAKIENIPLSVKGRYVIVTFTGSAPGTTPNYAVTEIEVMQEVTNIESEFNLGKKYGIKYSAQSSVNHVGNLTDDNWSNKWGAGQPSYPQYVEIDMGVSQNIDEITVGFTQDQFTWKVEIKDDLGNIIKSYEHNDINESYEKIKTFDFTGKAKSVRVTITGTNGSAWAALSELKVIQKNRDIIRGNQVDIIDEGTKEGSDINNLKDDNSDTKWLADGERKSVTIDLKNTYDLEKVIMKNGTQEPLKYKISISDDNVDYRVLRDLEDNDKVQINIINNLGKNAKGRYLKVDFYNQGEIELSELFVFSKDLTVKLGEIISKYSKILSSFEVGEGAGQYLQSDFDAFNNILVDAVANIDRYFSFDAIKELEATLKAAHKEFIEKVITVDRSALLSELDTAFVLIKELDGEAELESLREELKDVYNSSRGVYDKLKVSQGELDNAVTILAQKNKEVKDKYKIVVSKVNKFTSKDITDTSVTLSWTIPDSKIGLVGYVVYQDGKEITTLSKETIEYKVDNLRSNTIYGFKVVAKYSNGKVSKPSSLNIRTKKY